MPDTIKQVRSLIAKAWSSSDEWEVHLDKACELLARALEAKPDDCVLLTCYGAVLSDRGKHSRAVKVLEKAVALGSKDGNTFYNLAVALMNTPRRGQAMRWFKKAQQTPNNPHTWQAYFDPHGH